MERMQEGQSRCAEVALSDPWWRTGTIPKPASPPNRPIQIAISTTNIDSFKLVLWPECNRTAWPVFFLHLYSLTYPTLPSELLAGESS